MLTRIALALLAATLSQFALAQTPSPLVHVTNNAALTTAASSYGVVLRDGYQVAGDGGRAVYTYASSACSISGGDGGFQVSANDGGCWLADIRSGASLALWGAKADEGSGNTDNQPVFAKAIAAMGSIGGGRITIPKGQACYRINSKVTILPSNVWLVGEPGACVSINFATDSGIEIGPILQGPSTARTINSGVSSLVLNHSVVRTSNASLQILYSDRAKINDIACGVNAYFCVAVDNNATNTEVRNLQVRQEGQSGLALGCITPGLAANVSVIGADFNFQHRAAIEACNASGITLSHLNADFNLHGLWGHPGTGQRVAAVYTGQVFFDYSQAEGVLMDATGGGLISENGFDDTTWIVSCGLDIPTEFKAGLVGSFPVTPTAACLSLQAASGHPELFTNNVWKSSIFAAGGHGVLLNGGQYNQLGGRSAQNGSNCPDNNRCHNVAVGSNTSHWSWDGTAGGTTGAGGSTRAGYGVFVNIGSSDYYTIRGDLSGNVLGSIADLGSGIHKSFEGVEPAQTPISYTPAISTATGSLGSYSAIGQYIQHGSSVTFSVSLTITNNGSAGGFISISLPIANASAVTINVFGREAATGKAIVGIAGTAGSNSMNVVRLVENDYPGGTNYRLDLSGTYPITQ